MTIAEEITRLSNAKANIKQAIENKGVEVSDSALLDEYPALIDSIEVGSGGGSADPFYETMWNAITNNGTDYSYLFHNYQGTELDVSNWDTSNVTTMNSMFYDCRKLTQLDVSNWDTSNVKDMSHMFRYCESLTTIGDLSNWDTSNVTRMDYMFSYSDLESLDVSNFDTSNVTNMQNMFYLCTSLTTIGDISNWNTSNVTNMGSMFYNCYLLTTLDLSNWDISKVTTIGTAFNYCSALVDFKAPKNISANMSVANSTALSHDSLMSIINNLATISGKTLTLGATNKAKLTADELAIATNKGWKIA